MPFRQSPKILVIVLMAIWPAMTLAQQVADTSFHYIISQPAYQRGKGSVIVFDESHNNPQTLKGQYGAFNQLLVQDGYRIVRAQKPVTAELLTGATIYVSVNAMYDPMIWDLPARSAFSEEEINILYEWVKKGGSLFLIVDHMPCPGSCHSLARKFGFNLINGFALRKNRAPELFSRSRRNLHPSVITEAQGARIDSIRIWGGSAFLPPGNAEIISSLDEQYEIYLPSRNSEVTYPIPPATPSVSGAGFVNGAILQYEQGRVVVFAESAVFSAQLEGIKSSKRGMNHSDARQNAQFLLNIIHWLDGRL